MVRTALTMTPIVGSDYENQEANKLGYEALTQDGK